MKRIYCLALILIFLSISSSCSNNQKNNESVIDRMVSQFDSDNYKGRLTGTKENTNTAEYILYLLKEIGLDEYNGSYSHSYNHKFYNPKDQIQELTIEFGAEKKQCTVGEEFLLSNEFSDISLRGNITFNYNSDGIEDMFIVLDNSTDMINVSNKKVKGILIKRDIFRKTAIVKQNGTPIIQISTEVFELLKKNQNSVLTVKSISKESTIKAQNLVGMIKGKNSKNALIISAHFDHAGSIGTEQLSGAIDNISGLSVMLDLAKKLKESSATDQLECDVIFCAFNGEESELQGSKAFVSDIRNKYENINNLNLDCLGIVNGGNLLISAQNDKYNEWVQGLNELLSKKKMHIAIDLQGTITSDHISFSEHDIPSLMLTQENLNSIHTKEDTYKVLDKAYLKEFCENIFEYIKSYYANGIFEQSTDNLKKNNDHNHNLVTTENEEIQKILNAESAKLKFNQFKYIKIKDSTYPVINNLQAFNSEEDYMSFFKDSTIPSDINGYKFKQIQVCVEMDTNNIPIDSAELDKVYDALPVTKNNITSLRINYKDDTADDLLIISINIFKDKQEMHSVEITSEISDLKEKNVSITNDIFSCLLNPKDNFIHGVKILKEVNNKVYSVSISRGKPFTAKVDGREIQAFKPSWKYESDDDLEAFLESMNFSDILKHLF